MQMKMLRKSKKLLYSIKQFSFKYKGKQLFFLIPMLAILIFLMYLPSMNYSWYSQSVVKITSVEDSFLYENENNDGSLEQYYEQIITGIVMNGDYKDQELTIINQYSSSGVYDEKYTVSDKIFITVKKDDSGDLTGSIIGLKRDGYFFVSIYILFLAILILMKRKGLQTILSLIINFSLFFLALYLYQKGIRLFLLCGLLMVSFTVFSLLLISGLNRKSLIAIVSTLITSVIIFLLLFVSLHFSEAPDYAFIMEYITGPTDLAEIFISQLMIAGLGAVMDIAISMSTTLDELITIDPNISRKDLFLSGRSLGYDIMGTMINVMLFTYLCGSIPMLILEMKLDLSIFTILSYHLTMELYRFLLGGIGILLAIPISMLLSIFFLKRRYE